MHQVPPKIPEVYLRLHQILAAIPVSRSTWYRGIRSGRYPMQVRISANIVGWKQSEIARLVESFDSTDAKNESGGKSRANGEKPCK
ncbi:MAG: AlpA family phage regulatory protein [Armatimonadetes bacterium]|nr:AlpA family phage regulatory protein [Akkermansiaceae bacterium]